MEALLSFFSDLILFTAGLAVVVLWVLIILAVAIEIYDSFKEEKITEEEDVY